MVNRVYTVVYEFSHRIFTLSLSPDGGEGGVRGESGGIGKGITAFVLGRNVCR
jgi:hypothetical protein